MLLTAIPYAAVLRYFFLIVCTQNYIQELRNCKTKDAEQERVQKELGKIRKKYTSSKGLSGESKWLFYTSYDLPAVTTISILQVMISRNIYGS